MILNTQKTARKPTKTKRNQNKENSLESYLQFEEFWYEELQD